MGRPQLSVIIPCYNAAKTIGDTLLCFQTEFSEIPDLDYEILIVNDGSTDDTYKVVKTVSNPRIRYFEKSNTGVASTRNYGLLKAEGDYVWFFDADDQLFYGGGRRALSFLKQTNADIIRFASRTQDHINFANIEEFNNTSSAKISYHGKYKDFLIHSTIGFACWLLIVRRSLLLQHKVFFDESLAISEDVWWNIMLAYKLPDVNFIATDLNVVKYIVHQDSIVNTINPNRCREQLAALLDVYGRLNSFTIVPEYMKNSIKFWKVMQVRQCITRYLSCRFNSHEVKGINDSINLMIKQTGAQGKIISLFKVISTNFLFTITSQYLYQKLFLRYIKPRLGRN